MIRRPISSFFEERIERFRTVSTPRKIDVVCYSWCEHYLADDVLFPFSVLGLWGISV